MTESDNPILTLTAQIVSAHVEHNETSSAGLPSLIREVYQALAGVEAVPERPRALMADAPLPPVAAKKAAGKQTVFDDHLVCMDCGLSMKMLKRHLQTVHSLSPAQYRAKWNLPGDYPMVARQYADLRSSLAKESGLGKRPVPRGR